MRAIADFCRACTIELFGEEFADHNDMIDEELTEGQVHAGLCEGCGPGFFDKNGNRC